MSTTPTHKYLILFGKFSGWQNVDGVDKVVTKRPGDIIDLTVEQAEAKQTSVRLATPQEVEAYEARLRGETDQPPPIPLEHVSTAGAPPAPTPAVDPHHPPLEPGERPQRHFPEPAASAVVATPAVPAAQPVAAPAPAVAPPAAPSPAPPPRRPLAEAANVAKDSTPKPRARGDKGGKKKSGTKGRR